MQPRDGCGVQLHGGDHDPALRRGGKHRDFAVIPGCVGIGDVRREHLVLNGPGVQALLQQGDEVDHIGGRVLLRFGLLQDLGGGALALDPLADFQRPGIAQEQMRQRGLLAISKRQHALFAQRIAAIAGQHVLQIVRVAHPVEIPFDLIAVILVRPAILRQILDQPVRGQPFAFQHAQDHRARACLAIIILDRALVAQDNGP